MNLWSKILTENCHKMTEILTESEIKSPEYLFEILAFQIQDTSLETFVSWTIGHVEHRAMSLTPNPKRFIHLDIWTIEADSLSHVHW